MIERLRAGSLSASLAGADLIDVRWGSVDVASRIHVTVRDPEWGTIDPTVRGCTIERSDEAFVVHLDVAHDDGTIGFAWHGIVDGRADGSLTFHVDGLAERAFEHRRIGLVVLHPCRTYVEAPFEAIGSSGTIVGTFPREIAPQSLLDGRYQPMVDAFTELRVRLRGAVGVVFAFDGEEFELEDQRNWTDPSYKTYPTPLARSEPRTMPVGQRVVQSLAMDLDGSPPGAGIPATDELTIIRVGDPVGSTMPSIGSSLLSDVSTMNLAHVRLEVDVLRDDARETVEAAAEYRAPIELVLLVDDEQHGIRAIAGGLAGLSIARLIVQRRDGSTISGGLARSIRERLDGVVEAEVPLVGGTRDQFSELNRTPPDGEGIDAVAFCITPMAHASDGRSIMETLEIQAAVVRRASILAGGLPIVVSPVTVPTHLGPAFAAAWAIGSVASIAGAGATSITYSSSAPTLSWVAALHGAELLEAISSNPERVVAIAAGTQRVVVVNLTPDPQLVRFEGATGEEDLPTLTPFEIRSLSLATGARA